MKRLGKRFVGAVAPNALRQGVSERAPIWCFVADFANKQSDMPHLGPWETQ